MLAQISSRELTEWMAYEQMTGPLGPGRGDLHAAQITSTLLNVNRGKGRKAHSIADVVLRFDRHEPMSPEELYARIRQINAGLGGTVATTPEVPDTG